MSNDREAMLKDMLDEMAEDLQQEKSYNPDNVRIQDLEEEVAKLTRRCKSKKQPVDGPDKQQLLNEIKHLHEELDDSRVDYENAHNELTQTQGYI